MARAHKAKFTPKQRRQARHIRQSELKSGKRMAVANRIAWATVNKELGVAGKAAGKTASPRGRKGMEL